MPDRTDSGRRLLLLLIVFVVAAGALVVRLGYWQVAQRDQLVEDARRQIYYRAEVPSRRGQIFDRSGTIVLAATVMRDKLIVSAQSMTDAERAEMLAFLTEQLDLDADGVEAARVKLESRKPYLVIAKDLLPEQSEEIRAAARAAGIGDITFESESTRSYPQVGGSPNSTLAAHLLGFVNREGTGQYGVEQFYQTVLAGEPRIVEADRDAGGQPVIETERTVSPGVPGEDLRLTIDASLQLALEQEAMGVKIANGAKAVSVVVMDPWTGEIYAEASYPSYDGNDYAEIAAENPGRFLDPVVSEVYEPGSVFKMFTVVAGLEQGTTSIHKKYRDTGRLSLDDGKTRIEDSDGKAMGVMTLEDGIAYSRNVVAAKVAFGLARTTKKASTILHEVWTRLGFGSPTGIDLSGEVRGLINDPATRTWRQIDLANGSFGQGVAVTQIQLAQAYAAMINGGIIVQPHVVASQGPEPVSFATDAPVIDPRMSKKLATLMEHVLEIPWYEEYAQVPGYWVGGKTGTAQVWDAAKQRWAPNLYNFSCVGFIGREKGHPDLVIAVRIHEARPGRDAQGQLKLRVRSTELFRRVATDAIATPGLLPNLTPAEESLARVDQ